MDTDILFFLNGFVGKYGLSEGVIIFLAEKLVYFLLGAFLIYLFFSKADSFKNKIYIFLIPLASSIIARLGATEIIRFFYHRPRPFFVQDIAPLIEKNSYSFPSGHAAFIFAFAAAVFMHNRKWGAIFFAGGIITGIARIIAGIHYPSDILGGAAIGLIIGFAVHKFLKKKRQLQE